MPGSYRSSSPQSVYSRRSKSTAQSKQRKTDKESTEDQCGSEFVNVSLPPNEDTHKPSSSGPSVEHSPKTRYHPYISTHPQTAPKSPSSKPSTNHSPERHRHPYDRVARHYPYNTNSRPEIFNAHTLLCSVKLSDTMIADRPPPKVDEYPIAPVLSAYDMSGSLTHEEDARVALELARAARAAIQAHEFMLQAKIQEELVVLRILQRKAETVANTGLDAERQIGELTGMLLDQDLFSQKRVGEPMDDSSNGESYVEDETFPEVTLLEPESK